MQVNILEAKNRLSQLIKYAQAGDEVVIANRGYPVARLVPAKAANAAGATPNFLKWLENHPLPPTLNALRRKSMQELKTSATHGTDLS